MPSAGFRLQIAFRIRNADSISAKTGFFQAPGTSALKRSQSRIASDRPLEASRAMRADCPRPSLSLCGDAFN